MLLYHGNCREWKPYSQTYKITAKCKQYKWKWNMMAACQVPVPKNKHLTNETPKNLWLKFFGLVKASGVYPTKRMSKRWWHRIRFTNVLLRKKVRNQKKKKKENVCAPTKYLLGVIDFVQLVKSVYDHIVRFFLHYP